MNACIATASSLARVFRGSVLSQTPHSRARIDCLRDRRQYGYGTDRGDHRHGECVEHLSARHVVVRWQPQVFDALQGESPVSSKPEETARAEQPIEGLVADPSGEHTDLAEGRRASSDELMSRATGEVQDAAQAISEKCF